MREDDDGTISGLFDAPLPGEELTPEERARVIAGRYEILERIGEGGMGQVLRVRHRRLGKTFALKLMQAEVSVEPEARDLFEREARLASALSHPNIVSMIDFGEDPDWGLFLVMELIEGELLSDRIERQGPLPIKIVCSVAAQLVAALEHSHQRHVVHGDLKSDNVLCVTEADDERRKWSIKLLDFGMARLANTAAPAESRVAGTPEYLAPERITGQPPAPSNDIYALGIILYELLGGSVPFSSDDPTQTLERQLHEAPEPVGARRGEVLDPALDALVERCLAKQPDARFQTVDEIGRALRAYMDELGLRERKLLRRRSEAPGESRAAAAAAAFEALALPAAGLRADGTIVVANKALIRALQLDDPSAIEGGNILDTFLADAHPQLRDDIRVAAFHGKPVRRRALLRHPSGRELPIRIAVAPASGDAGDCTLILHALASER